MERRWQVLCVVCIGIFVSSLDLFIVNIAFPDIRADLGGATLADLSWVLNGYAIVFAALLVPAGRWADRVGLKRTFLAGLGLFTLASAACALSGSVEVLVGARVVQAAGAALLVPASLGLLLPEFPGKDRPVAIGIWAASGGVAAAAGPVVGGLLVGLSWHWVFLVNVPIGLAAIVLGARVLREIRDEDTRVPDVLGALAFVAGTAALVGAIVNGEEWGWTSGRVLGALGAAAALLTVVAIRARRHPAPLIEPAIVAVRSFRLAVLGALLFFTAFAALLLGSVLFLTEVWEEDVLAAGLMLSPGPLAAALASVPGARLGARFGAPLVGGIGAGLFAAGGASWTLLLGEGTAYATTFLPGMIVGGVGVGLINPALTSIAAASLPPTRFATGAALLTMGRQLGSALGIAVLVPVLGTATDAAAFDGAWVVLTLAALAAAATLVSIGRVDPVPVPAVPAAAAALPTAAGPVEVVA